MAGMKQDEQKALDVVRMLTEADSDIALRENFRKVAALFGVEDMLRDESSVSFARIERYADRQKGEDAIMFYQRTWGSVPHYREDVEAHDPDLIPAIQMRCGNMNRNRAPDDPMRVSQKEMLPPRRPLGRRVEMQRESARRYVENKRNAALAPTTDFDAVSNVLPTSLPDAPPKYFYKPRMQGGIEKYLRDNWLPYIQAGILSRPDLKRIDKPAYTALNNFLRSGKTLAAELRVLDRSETAQRALIEAAPSAEEMKRFRRHQSALYRSRHRKP